VSRTDAKRWLLLGLAAFGVRAGVAALTEYRPLFPAYYYQDSVFAENIAWDMATTWRSGTAYRTGYSPPQRAHAALLAVPYTVVGRRPFVNKLLNALIGAASVVLLGLAFRSVVPDKTAFAAASFVCVWPSHAFYTSQNFKESPTLALCYAALALLLPAMVPGARPSARRAAAAVLMLVLAGLLRSYVLAVLAASLAFGAALALRPKAGRAAAALALAAAIASPLAYRGVEQFVFRHLLASAENAPDVLPPMAPIPVPPGPVPAAWSPAGIGRRRAQSQASDQAYALKSAKRAVASQIEPDTRLETWSDLAFFLPRAGFQVLFMPLPGYPMEGKLGRWFAAIENVLLLVLSGAALLGLSRSKFTPARVAMIAFFLVMTAGSALMEFDLGSASRHKLLYLPMLFPFAAEELLRWRRA